MRVVLVVDDNVTDLFLTTDTLKSLDSTITIMEAENGNEAVEIFKEQKPDLIILDVHMYPGMDGLNTTKKLRALNGVKIVIFSMSDYPDDIKQAFDLGADAYLVKEMDPDKFTEEVEIIKKVFIDNEPVEDLKHHFKFIKL